MLRVDVPAPAVRRAVGRGPDAAHRCGDGGGGHRVRALCQPGIRGGQARRRGRGLESSGSGLLGCGFLAVAVGTDTCRS